MRIYLSKRIFMNEADGSSGNGAPAAPSAPPAPAAEPTAPVTPAASTVDISAVVDAKLKAFQNEFFANARKAGLLKKDESATPAPQPTTSASSAQAGLSMSDVEAMLERERVITRVATEHKLSDAVVKRMKGMIAAEKPDDVSGWVSSFVTDMGLARTSEPTPATPSPAVVPNTAPLSDRGSPAPNGAVGWRYELNNPIGMSAAARAQMDAELGVDKARKMRLDAARNQASTMKVAFGPKG